MEPTHITIDDFKKAEIRIGTIVRAEKVPDADKLFMFGVDCGEGRIRTILSGVAPYFESPEQLLGKQVPVITNLAPRTIRGIESEGMILYAVGEGSLTTISPGQEVPPGTRVQ